MRLVVFLRSFRMHCFGGFIWGFICSRVFICIVFAFRREVYGPLLFYFIILLKCLISMLFIDILLLEKLICMNCLLRNLDLLNLEMSGILWLACWLVSLVTICAFILIITFLLFFNDLFSFFGALRYYWGR